MNLKRVLTVMLAGVLMFAIWPETRYTFASADSGQEMESEQEVEPTAEEYLISNDDPQGYQGGMSTRVIRSCDLSFIRVNSTKAIAELRARSSKNLPAMTSTIYLQKYNSQPL